jgi:hypothetical protein
MVMKKRSEPSVGNLSPDAVREPTPQGKSGGHPHAHDAVERCRFGWLESRIHEQGHGMNHDEVKCVGLKHRDAHHPPQNGQVRTARARVHSVSAHFRFLT